MNQPSYRGLLLIVFASFFTGCGGGNKSTAEKRVGPIVVVAVNEPLRYFAERIGGEFVEASCPCPMKMNPSTWSPDSAALEEFNSADLILLNGGGYARWTITTSLPDSRIANTGRAFKEKWLTMAESVRHQHGPEGEHSHEATIGEFWLDPGLAILQAERIERALVSLDAEHATEFGKGLDLLTKDLRKLEQSIRDTVGDDTQLFAAEPAFEYVAATAGQPLNRLSWANVEEPTESEFARFVEKRASDKTPLFLLSSPSTSKLAKQLEAIGVRTVVFDICATTSAKSYLDRMRENVELLKQLPQ